MDLFALWRRLAVIVTVVIIEHVRSSHLGRPLGRVGTTNVTIRHAVRVVKSLRKILFYRFPWCSLIENIGGNRTRFLVPLLCSVVGDRTPRLHRCIVLDGVVLGSSCSARCVHSHSHPFFQVSRLQSRHCHHCGPLQGIVDNSLPMPPHA